MSGTTTEDEQSHRSVIIAGSRSFDQPVINHHLVETGRRVVARALACLVPFDRTDVAEVVSGTARGPDRWGEAWADPLDFVELTRMPADWDTHGKAAGPKRNKRMAEHADTLVAFYDGESAGTANMISTAREHGLDVHVISMDEPAKRRVLVTGER